jgi:hypothetical protein
MIVNYDGVTMYYGKVVDEIDIIVGDDIHGFDTEITSSGEVHTRIV